jgi:predicted Zn-dependent peptidase
VQQGQLANGLPYTLIRQGTQEVVRIDYVFWAGRPFERQPLTGRATAALLKEGSRHYSGAELAEQFDFYGATLTVPYQTDVTNVALYSLSRHVPQLLPHFMELLIDPHFREPDLQAYVRRQQHKLREDLSQNDVLAYRHLTEAYYGTTHPYGYNSYPETYAALELDWLQEHHQRCYQARNGFLLISGQFDQATEDYILRAAGELPMGTPQQPPSLVAQPNASPGYYHFPHSGPPQSAIRIGRPLFPRTHPDANGMHILATLLGGFFGSRLMMNLREDKGYTYHVGAAYDSLAYDGSFQIDLETSHEHVEPTLKVIREELERLRDVPIPAKELQTVRNYLMGNFLSMIDGPFNWAETLRTLFAEHLGQEYLPGLAEEVLTIDAQRLQQLAQEYLDEEALWTVVVGE